MCAASLSNVGFFLFFPLFPRGEREKLVTHRTREYYLKVEESQGKRKIFEQDGKERSGYE
jgi:hypothetical protein